MVNCYHNKKMAAILRVAEVLESYRGRDKIIRLASYSSLFIGGCLRNTKLRGLGESLSILAKNLNECRTMLRLFDDLSMFLHCTRYGLGSKVTKLLFLYSFSSLIYII